MAGNSAVEYSKPPDFDMDFVNEDGMPILIDKVLANQVFI